MITTEIRVLATREFAAIDQSFHPRPDLPAELECAVAWASGLWNGAFLSLTNQQIKSITSPVRSSVIIPVDATATQKDELLTAARSAFHLRAAEPADVAAIRDRLERYALQDVTARKASAA
ncbi:hypothetical protein [Agrobacterium vitis]|uniref:hypothetical protein n=1 Tax=Agrobacterium vitis TaxID=373 RepID=UPI00157276CD|nr:hypothetical protein [Agrobacterium vitis]NSZ19325.1 hypothetical protein [Agrobacterium vitis]QZO06193.1 hypothetical protein K4831_21330 [Agrobacterium vitis]UJL90516.1 hypothetical protein AVF2S5_21365 [Agrobacterium vitis]